MIIDCADFHFFIHFHPWLFKGEGLQQSREMNLASPRSIEDLVARLFSRIRVFSQT
jgi:hypothetical protein